VSADETTTATTLSGSAKYGDLVREARELEARGAHNAAAMLWDAAKDAARRTKRSTAEAVEGAMRCRAACGDEKAVGVEKVGAILDNAAEPAEPEPAVEPEAEADEVKRDEDARRHARAIKGEAEDPEPAKKTQPKAPRTRQAAPKKSPAMDAHESNLAAREAARAKQNSVKIGAKLEHKVRGEVLATCTWHGPRDWRYRNKAYTSISAAANAAAAHLRETGVYKPGGRLALNGWVFWGVEKREP
jgi:outer membrane biosynthesis protein TonB